MVSVKAWRHQLKNLDLWAKIVILVVASFLLLFLALSFFGWEILMDQHGQERRLNKSFAAEQAWQDGLHRMGLVTQLLSTHISREGNLSAINLTELSAQRKILKVLADTQFILVKDKDGNILSSDSEGLILKEGYRFQAEKRALAGQAGAGLEAYPPGTFRGRSVQEADKSGLLVVAAAPLKKGQEVAGVLVVGHFIQEDCPLATKISKQLNALISFYYQGRELVSVFKGKSTPQPLRNTLSAEGYFNSIAKGEPLYGSFTRGSKQILTAYKPLRDIDGQIIGALLVGQEQTPIINMFKAFLVRFGFLALVSLAVVLAGLYWLYQKVDKPLADLVQGAYRITGGDFSARIHLRRTVPCWQLKECRQISCPAFGNENIRCWFIGGQDCPCCSNNSTGNNPKDAMIQSCCRDCDVFIAYRGNRLYQLADAFNFMASKIEEKHRSLEILLQELQAQNEELNAQQEELVAQQEALVAQQNDLLCVNRRLEQALAELDSSQNVIYTLVLALEARDRYTSGHSERVASYAVKLAEGIGLSREEQERIKHAAILHDLGKIGISDCILGKSGKLEPEEMKLVQEHPVIAEKICQPLKTTANLLPIIRHHHEWVNGQGYPDGLRGTEIPLAARILAIADAFDAMTSDRPYRKSLSREQAARILLEGAGVQWDADLVKAFLALLAREEQEQQAAASAQEPSDE